MARPRPGPTQPVLFAGDEMELDLTFATARRIQLDATSWVEHVPGWLAGSEQLLAAIAASAGWEQRQRWMYDRKVTEPRLTAEYPDLADAPEPMLHAAAAALSGHYAVPYDGLWINLYRDHRDSTGWHGDRPTCKRDECVVPVLSLGVLNCSALCDQTLANLCFNERVKLAEWARENGVHPQTAYRWFREDRMPVPARRLESGTIWVDAALAAESGRVVVYARVSSHDQRQDLDRQVARLTGWATANGHAVGEVVTEVGSGVNGKRPKLRRILSDPSAGVVVVEHRDRLARFGTEHLEAALAAQGRKIMVADPGETADDLVRDMIEVLTSMCARLYGRRGARNRAMRAVTAAKHEPGGEAPADGQL